MKTHHFYKKIQDKQSGEKFKKVIRKSIIAYILNTFSDTFLILLWGWFIYLGRNWIIYGDLKFHLTEFIVLSIYWLVVLWIWVYFWYYTYLLVTTHRIEKHRPTYLFWDYKEILWYHEINKISYSYPSLIAKLLKYWTIEIMAWESDKNNIIFEQAPKPEKIVEELRMLKKLSHRK